MVICTSPNYIMIGKAISTQYTSIVQFIINQVHSTNYFIVEAKYYNLSIQRTIVRHTTTTWWAIQI